MNIWQKVIDVSKNSTSSIPNYKPSLETKFVTKYKSYFVLLDTFSPLNIPLINTTN